MLGIFKPSVNLINQLRYPQKLIVLGTLVVVIVLILMYEVSEQAATQLVFSKQELVGIEVNKPLISLMRKIQNYRTAKNRSLHNLTDQEEVRSARVVVDNDILLMTDQIRKLNPSPELLGLWDQIKDDWDNIKLAHETSVEYGKSYDLMDKIQKLILNVCDSSNLTLDPEIDSYYLVDTYCTILPRYIENLKKMQDIGTTSLYLKNISEADLDNLHITAILTKKFSLPSINENIGKVILHDESLAERFSNIVRVLNQDTEKALSTINSTVIIEKFDFPIDDFNSIFTAAEIDGDQLYARTASTLVELIHKRIDKLYHMFYSNLAVVIFGLIIFIYLFIGIYLSIIQSIRQLVLGSEEIAKGNLKAKVKLESQDELSQVADSFNTMREVLRSIVSELHHVVTAVGRGNLEQRVDLSNKEGFAKELSDNINKMTDVFQGIIKDIITVLDFLSKGNLTIRVTREYHGLFAELKSYVNDTIDDLESLIKSIKVSTETIRNAAEEISLGNSDLEKRTEQQAASLEETSVSMSKITDTVQQNAENAKEAHDYVQTTSNIALEGGEVVNQVVVMMNAINESARQITEITNVIDSIAFQTNILALNAAVEAARAGEQGRGFTVVASEIRNLAQRSSVSAQGIKTLINTSVEQVSEGKKLADEAGKTMKQVVSSVENVSRTMSEIVSASIEQTNGIQQINVAIAEMDQVTQQNSALVEEAARSSESLKNQTEQMNELVNVFKISSDEEKDIHNQYLKGRRPHKNEVDQAAEHSGRKAKKIKNKPSKSPLAPPKSTKDNPNEWTEF